MFKLVALDVDGTLLNSHHELTPAVAEAVRTAQAQGVYIVLATGKQYSAITSLIEQLELTAPQITSHGALVTNPVQNTILHQQCIPFESGRRAIAIGAELGVTMVVAGHGKTFAVAHNADIDYMLTYGDPVPQILSDLTQALEPAPTHLMALAYQRDALYAEAYQRFKAELGDVLNVSLSSPYYIELLHPNASKGRALAAVCAQLGIDWENTLVAGDSFNDLSMFEFAGLAVAMDNAPGDVKKRANLVAPSNNDDGVAHLLREYVLR
jgi:hypothetical protein